MRTSQDADGDGYVEAYVSEVDAVVDGLRGHRPDDDLSGVPKWASDSPFRPVSGDDPGVATRVADRTVRQHSEQ
jgi:hypothetical protein